MNISNNVASILAHKTMLNTSANNIANINTDGFIPKDTNIINTANSVSGSTREADDTNSIKSQTNLSKEIPELIITKNGVEINANVIKAQDEMLGTLLDIKG